MKGKFLFLTPCSRIERRFDKQFPVFDFLLHTWEVVLTISAFLLPTTSRLSHQRWLHIYLYTDLFLLMTVCLINESQVEFISIPDLCLDFKPVSVSCAAFCLSKT